jgi:hypothetical protein
MTEAQKKAILEVCQNLVSTVRVNHGFTATDDTRELLAAISAWEDDRG